MLKLLLLLVICSFIAQIFIFKFILIKQKLMFMDFTELKNAVAAQNAVIASTVALLTGLKTKLDAAIESGNPAELAELSAEIAANTAELAAAVLQNTPAENTEQTPPIVVIPDPVVE